ncbi:Uncharacterised protein [Klebsiella pneumoniae]|nr:Uncharacterised protein [Klebsiella pneumoniae]
MAIIEISVSRRGKGVQVRTRMVRNDDDSELVRNTAKRIHMSLGEFIHGLIAGYSQRLKIYRHPRQIKTIFTNPWSGVAMCRLPINDPKMMAPINRLMRGGLQVLDINTRFRALSSKLTARLSRGAARKSRLLSVRTVKAHRLKCLSGAGCMLSGGSVAEIVITLTESGENLNISAIISAEKKDSRLVKDVSNIIAPLILATASAESLSFFNI